MNKKTQKSGAAVGCVSSNELNQTTKEQITTPHTEESNMIEKKINTEKVLEENSVPVRTTEQETSCGAVPCAESPEITPSFESDKSRLVSNIRNLFGDKDAKTLFAADRQFVSSLLAEICYRGSGNQDDSWQEEKNQYYEETFKKLEQANPEELYEDVCQILDISHDYVPTDYKSNAPMHFQNKVSDIINKYGLAEYKFLDTIQLNKFLMRQINKNNLSEE